MMEGAYEEFTWENFKRKFLAKYFPDTARERDGIDEAYMYRRFQGGLRYELQDAVVPLGIRHFQVL
ncbi:gag polyprotein, partial [Trifolium medium]|nr:gag polyprotein [Trifolium medium]